MGGKWLAPYILLVDISGSMHLQNVHAVGDRANGIVLDAFEASLQGVNVTASRPRLEHAQLLTEADMKRLGRLGGELEECDYWESSSTVNQSLPVSNLLMRE